MRKEDYKRALDDIKCSDEFKEKMEKMLTIPEGVVPEGYEDSVSSLEIAPKRNWLKTVAAAAAVVVLVGGAGTGAYQCLRNMNDELPPDVVATEPSNTVYSTPFGDITGIELEINDGNGPNTWIYTDIPVPMVTDIVQVLNDSYFAPSDTPDDLSYKETIKLRCMGEEPFELVVKDNNMVECFDWENSKDGVYYPDSANAYNCLDLYFKIYGLVAKNIVYTDLSDHVVEYDTDETVNSETLSAVNLQALSNDKKQRVREAFEKYADSIEVDYTSEGYPLLSGSYIVDVSEIEGMGYSPIVFGNYASLLIDNRYIVKINDDGTFEIFYLSSGGVGYTYVFNAPVELCTEIHNILTDESSTPPPWADVGWDENTKLAFYHDGCQHSYVIGADNWYKSYFDKLDWTDTGLPEGEYDAQNEFDFFVGDGILKIDSEGNAYYDKVYGKDTFYSFGASIYTDLLNALKAQTEMTFEHEGTLPERVRECLSDNESPHWGKYRVAETDVDNYINFTVDDEDRSRLIEAIESTEWEESPNMVEDSYIRNVTFIIDEFWFDRFGDVCDHDDGKIFSAVEGDKINEINEILEGMLKKDSCAYAQYMLREPKMQYTSMRCAVLPLGMTYEEASVDDSINKDLDELRNGLLSDLQTINIHSKSCNVTAEDEESTSFALTLELDTTRRWDIEFTIDICGTPLYGKKTETNTETGEQKLLEGFRVVDLEYFHDIES